MIPTEVRVGNMIQCETRQKQYIVEGWMLKPDEDDDCECLRHSIGIPITEEWLVKFGFDKQSKYPQTWNKAGMALWYYPERPSVMLHLCKPSEFNYMYVHQLQNLYFALTGKELTYTP